MEQMEQKESFFHKNKGLLSPILMVVVLLAAYFIGPFRLVAVVSGSMEPTIPTWSLCVINIRRPYEKIQVGDVIVYLRRSDGALIIHRVIEKTDVGMITKGDANRIDDGVSTAEDNYFGVSLFHIPGVGKLAMKGRTPAGIAVIAVVFAGILVWSAADERRERRKKEETQEEQK